ncbi:hypothetical protein HZB07_02855 [Candidatus Saganbacteria bacterium]|nr:hypothetical protein [Candidatus Saganbacteria bacterium]
MAGISNIWAACRRYDGAVFRTKHEARQIINNGDLFPNGRTINGRFVIRRQIAESPNFSVFVALDTNRNGWWAGGQAPSSE